MNIKIMKYAFILLIGFAIIIAFGFAYRYYKKSDSSGLEMPKYEVIKKDKKIEIRAYNGFMIATTKNQGEYRKSMSNSFRRLASTYLEIIRTQQK